MDPKRMFHALRNGLASIGYKLKSIISIIFEKNRPRLSLCDLVAQSAE